MKSKPAAVTSLLPVPLYTQIKDILRDRILEGVYKSHEQMPSESELMKVFKVSRITVRQALGDLQKEGLIFKVQGKGSYVSKPKAFQNLARLQGFGEAMATMGYETYSRVIGSQSVPAGSVVGARLNVAADEMVVEIRRVRFLNREPISVDVSYLPQAVGERLLREDLAHRDVFLILENDFGLPLGQAELQIEAMLADEALARLLKVVEGAPILRIERLTFTAEGKPLDFEYLYYRGDAFQYRLRVERGTLS